MKKQNGGHWVTRWSLVLAPDDFDVDIVEIRIIQIAAVMASHALGKGFHSDRISFVNDPAESLKLNESLKQINACAMPLRCGIVD